MTVITIESDAFNKIMDSIKKIEEHISKPKTKPVLENWLSIPEALKMLHVSRRTLQTYRDTGVLPFSKEGAKIYFRESDLQAHLMKHYNKAFKRR